MQRFVPLTALLVAASTPVPGALQEADRAPLVLRPHCAVPPAPASFDVRGPDGRPVTLTPRGSAWNLWYEDEAGRAVLPRGADYVYARLDGHGELRATRLVVGRDAPTGEVAVGARPVASAVRLAPLPFERGTVGREFASATGTAKNLVLLLRFADHGPSGQNRTLPSTTDVEVIMNQPGGDPVLAPTGSVRDHYVENSYGQFAIDSTVVGWLDVPGDEADYAGGISGLGTVVWDLIEDGLAAADPLVDFSDFDQDGDGWIDAITFLHSGYGAEWGGTDVYGTQLRRTACGRTSGGSRPGLQRRGRQRQRRTTSRPGCGTSPARTPDTDRRRGRTSSGHFFGMPDLYDTDGSSQRSIGNWCRDGRRCSWGFDGDAAVPDRTCLAWSQARSWAGSRPQLPHCRASHSLRPRSRLNPTGVPASTTATRRASTCSMENREQTGFDAVIPQEGLAIWHVDETKGSFGFNDPNTDEGHPFLFGWPEDGSHYRVALLQADADFDMERGFNRGDSGDVYHGFGVDAITGITSPDLQAYQGGNLIANDNAITDVGASAATIELTYSNGMLPTVQNVALPPGRVGQPYSLSLDATGGTPPYAWTEFRPDPAYTTVVVGGALPIEGTAMGWQADEATWSLTLPFAFPFYETGYTELQVSSNGFLDFVPSEQSEPFNAPLHLRSTLRVAPLWDDLTTANPGEDVFVDVAASHVRIRWQGSSVATGDPVNFAAVLHPDGRILFEYGAGNANLSPTVGISRGYGSDFVLVPGYDAATSAHECQHRAPRARGVRAPGGAGAGPERHAGGDARGVRRLPPDVARDGRQLQLCRADVDVAGGAAHACPRPRRGQRSLVEARRGRPGREGRSSAHGRAWRRTRLGLAPGARAAYRARSVGGDGKDVAWVDPRDPGVPGGARVPARERPRRNHYLTDDDHGFQLCLGWQVRFGRTPGVDVFNAYGPLVVYGSALGHALARGWWGRRSCARSSGRSPWCSRSPPCGATRRRWRRSWRWARGSRSCRASTSGTCGWCRWRSSSPSTRSWGRGTKGSGVVGGFGSARACSGPCSVSAGSCVRTSARWRRWRAPRSSSSMAAGPSRRSPWASRCRSLPGSPGSSWPRGPRPRATSCARPSSAVGWPSRAWGRPSRASTPRRPWGPRARGSWPMRCSRPASWPACRSGSARRCASAGAGGAVADDELTRRRRTRFLVACAFLSGSVLHQALHRKDGQHLLQVLGPALVGVFVWGDAALRRLRGEPPVRVALRWLVAFAVVAVGSSLERWGRVDLARTTLAPGARYRALANPLAGGVRQPLLRPILRARELTGPDDAVLVFPLWPQAYVFAERRMSGKLHGYYPGVFDAPPWSDDNLAAIRADPPALVLVTGDFVGRAGPAAERYARYRRAHGGVDAFVREHYPRVVYDDGGLLLLGPP